MIIVLNYTVTVFYSTKKAWFRVVPAPQQYDRLIIFSFNGHDSQIKKLVEN